VIALVLDCVDRDPRCDPQLDSRADYYACLLLAAEADPAMVESLVRAHEQPPDDEWPTGNVLPLDVLVGMAARGSRQAQAAVVRYLATGARWLDVLEWGQEHYERTPRLSSWRSTVDGLGAVLCERFPSNDLLFAALEETGIAWYLSADSAPWSVWAARNPAIAAAIRQSPFTARNFDKVQAGLKSLSTEAVLDSMSTDELLGIEVEGVCRAASRVLAKRTGEGDARLLIAAAREETLVMRGPAIEALAHQQRPEALEIAAEVSDAVLSGLLRGYMFRALVALRYDATRGLARDWLSSDQTTRRRAAGSILEQHAAADDVAMIRAYVRAEPLDCVTGDMYLVLDLVRALARHPGQGPYDELGAIFDGIPYSFGRGRVAAALAATDPKFVETRAVECLWDCESEVRDVGIEHVNPDHPAVRGRLQDIAADWAEDPDTQRAARARLNQH
jgi:hypothetical protein